MTTAQIEQSEVRDAAEAMLAALKRDQAIMLSLREWFEARNQTHHGLNAGLRQNHAAIAQAESAGIRVKD